MQSQSEVLRHVEVGDHALGGPVLGDETRVRWNDGVAAVGPRAPGEHQRELALAVSLDARHAHDLASAHDDPHASQCRLPARAAQLDLVEPRDHLTGRRAREGPQGARFPTSEHLAQRVRTGLTDHCARERGGVHLGPGGFQHGAPPAQNGDPVRHREHLVQLVRHQHDTPAGARLVAQEREQRGDLGRGEHGCRLVEREDVRLLEQHLEDLDPLALAHPQRGNRDVEGHGEPGRVGKHRRALAHAGERQLETAPTSAHAQREVLEHGEVGDQREVLMDEADARGPCVARGAEADRLAAHSQLAAVGRVESGEDLEQGGLAGAVLSEHGVHLAGPQRELGAAQRGHRAEALVDVAKADRDGIQDQAPPLSPSTKGTRGTSSWPARMARLASSMRARSAGG